MTSFYRKLFNLFSKKEKYALFGFCLLNIIGSFLEVLGIGAIIPIVTIFTKPELIEKNALLSELKDLLK